VNANRQLPLIDNTVRHGSRSHETCKWKCGNQCDQPEANTSGNQHIQDILATTVSRRTMLAGGAAGAVLALTPGGTGALSAAAMPAPSAAVSRGRPIGAGTFRPIPPNTRDAVRVPKGFQKRIIARWGDPVLAGAPPFDVYAQTPEAQAEQFGYNCDFIGFLQLSKSRAVLSINHEFTNPELMFPAAAGYTPEQKISVEMMAHGLTVLELTRRKAHGSWRRRPVRQAPLNRRVTAHTPFEVTGPAAGSDLMKTTADPAGKTVLGTLNNCAGGVTPWQTTLHGEENFHQYFDNAAAMPAEYVAWHARYGMTPTTVTRGWSAVDPRFDLAANPHEPFRFGWIVELDPLDPTSTPRKRTMLGRVKHEGANIIINDDGHVVAYTGDDERGEYIYRFVSRDTYDDSGTRAARAHNLSLLDHGVLSVARFTGDGTADGQYDGTGEWIPLTSDTESFVPGMTVAEVLILTRLAADTVSATRMDRPEDIEPNLHNGRVYCALTNNSNRGTTFPVDEANPLATSMVRASLDAPLTPASGNRNGYVLEMTANGGDHTAADFAWLLFLVCGDPAAPETYFGGFPKDQVSPISCPDNVAFDVHGDLWISTDGNALGSNDGLFAVPLSGAQRGHVQQFLTVPPGAETCGPWLTDDGAAVFIAVQHPGEVTGSTFETPASTWPHTDPFPRPSVVRIRRA
jgi:secreted PhoX family phosphatase